MSYERLGALPTMTRRVATAALPARPAQAASLVRSGGPAAANLATIVRRARKIKNIPKTIESFASPVVRRTLLRAAAVYRARKDNIPAERAAADRYAANKIAMETAAANQGIPADVVPAGGGGGGGGGGGETEAAPPSRAGGGLPLPLLIAGGVALLALFSGRKK